MAPQGGQLALPLGHGKQFTREGFVAAPSNAGGLALVESWPDWSVNAAAICGPKGSGKSHLAEIWRRRAQAVWVSAQDLSAAQLPEGPAIIDDADSMSGDGACAVGFFHALECARRANPLLLTGSAPPSQWPCALPDLKSRLAALAFVEIGVPDDALLAGIARNLFAERQLAVPEAVVRGILASIERSTAALIAFVEDADAVSLAENRPISLAVVRELLARRDKGVS